MIWKEAASLFINPTPSQDVKIKSEPPVKNINNTISTKQNKNDKVKAKPSECKQNRVAVIERVIFELFLKGKKKINISGTGVCFSKTLIISLFRIIIK